MRNMLLFLGITAMFVIMGCILNDELTTMVIHPDGSADWVCFKSNIRSSEQGEKGAQELLKVIEDFEARRGSDFKRIADAGGHILDSRWVQREEPYATLVMARFPNAASIERFWTIKSDDGKVLIDARFTIDHHHRRLSFTIPGSTDRESQGKETPSFKEFRHQQANGIAETRIAVADGHILDAEGFVIADDKRSCLLDPQRIDELLHQTKHDVELFVEWEITTEKDH